jgi:hypothetical protein
MCLTVLTLKLKFEYFDRPILVYFAKLYAQ